MHKKLAERLAKKHKEESGEAGGKKLVLEGIGNPDLDRTKFPVFSIPEEEDEDKTAELLTPAEE